MRKHIISHSTKQIEASDQPWLDVEHLARVEITSEDQAYPIEAALLSGKGSGWRAAEAGQQMLQLLFDQPQRDFGEGLIARAMHDEFRARRAFTTARAAQEQVVRKQKD